MQRYVTRDASGASPDGAWCHVPDGQLTDLAPMAQHCHN